MISEHVVAVVEEGASVVPEGSLSPSSSPPSPPGVLGGVVHGGRQGSQNLGNPGNEKRVLIILGKPKIIMPDPEPPHRLQPTITGTTVGSLDPSEVVVIQVFDVHSG